MTDKFWGKYRGKVTGTHDPLNLGRIQVEVANVFGDGRSNWAMPCTPYAGKDIGLFMVPPVGSNIWVEFEDGDTAYPIWSGCFWGEQELPAKAQIQHPEEVQLFRAQGVTLVVSREATSKGLTLNVEQPVVDKSLRLVYNPDGIELNHDNQMSVCLLTSSQEVVVKNGSTTTVKLTADTIELQEAGISVKITNNSIELVCGPSKVQLSTNSGIDMSSTPAVVKVGASGVDINSGGMGTIAIALGGVNVNRGALEVT